MKVYITTRKECSGRWQLAYECFKDKDIAESKFPSESGDYPIEYDLPNGSTICYSIQSKSPTSSCRIDSVTNNIQDAYRRVNELKASTSDQRPINPDFPDYGWEYWIVDMEIK